MKAFISIDYDEFTNHYNYVSVDLDQEIYFFKSGDVIKDWYKMIKFVIEHNIISLSYSSSVDHFIFDNEMYGFVDLLCDNETKDFFFDYLNGLTGDFIATLILSKKQIEDKINFKEYKKYCE